MNIVHSTFNFLLTFNIFLFNFKLWGVVRESYIDRLRKVVACTERVVVHVTTIIIVNLGPLRYRYQWSGWGIDCQFYVATRGLPLARQQSSFYEYQFKHTRHGNERWMLLEIIVILILCTRSMLRQFVLHIITNMLQKWDLSLGILCWN